MKKFFTILLFGLFIFSTDNVYAITKEELLNEIKEGYTINDSLFILNDEDYKKVEGYIKNNDISEEDLDFLMRKIDEIVLIIDRGNSTNLYELTEDEIKEIDLIIDEMIEKTGIEIADRHALTARQDDDNKAIAPIAIALVSFIVVAGLIALLKLGSDE